jgi:hypothetical protein
VDASLIVAVLSLLVAIAAVVYARRSAAAAEDSAHSSRRNAGASERSASSSERSEKEAERAAAAAERSANSAERSEDYAQRSASAAERSAQADETAAEAAAAAQRREDERAERERQAEERRRMPRFEPIENHSTGTYNLHLPNGPLHAHLKNVGGSAAMVESAVLHHLGKDTHGEVWVDEEAPRAAEPAPRCRVPVGGHLVIDFPVAADIAQQHDPLELRLLYTGPEGRLGSLIVQLLRSGTTGHQRPQWRTGDIETEDSI